VGELPAGGTGFTRNGTALFRSVGVGGFAEHTVMPASAVVAVPPDTPLEQACLLGCGVGTGLGASINTAGVAPGDRVAVFGVGGVGIGALQGARIAGAAQIVAVDPVDERREAARTFGATDAFEPGSDVHRRIKAITGGGADHAIDTSGRQDTLDAALACLRAGGTVTLVGMPAAGDDARTITRTSPFILQEKRLQGSAYGSCHPQRDIPRFLALARSGELDLARMVTAIRPLGEVGTAIADLEAGRGIRTVITLND
jgi:Zn-dependent alcohol dehydrogenase